jgi:(p)ppGpp synthase/HD superfamily hydrolase
MNALNRSTPHAQRFPSAQADLLAARLLGDLRTRLGGLQIAHARRVAAAVRGRVDDRTVAAALLHDVVEKTTTTLEELQNLTEDAQVVALVAVLTRRDEETDRNYLARCAREPATYLIKRADLADKVLTEDVTVPPMVAQLVQRQAIERLTLLHALARDLDSGGTEAAV